MVQKIKIDHIKSSGNVFADMGLPNAEELLAKAKLGDGIASIIEHRGITQTAAGKIVGTSQAKISDIIHGRLEKFTIDRLIKMLIAFDRDVQIKFKPKPRSRDHAVISVASEDL